MQNRKKRIKCQNQTLLRKTTGLELWRKERLGDGAGGSRRGIASQWPFHGKEKMKRIEVERTAPLSQQTLADPNWNNKTNPYNYFVKCWAWPVSWAKNPNEFPIHTPPVLFIFSINCIWASNLKVHFWLFSNFFFNYHILFLYTN